MLCNGTRVVRHVDALGRIVSCAHDLDGASFDRSYAYDAAGCVTRITRGADTWDLAWNGQYQLVSVSTNGVFAESYEYDALGRRVTTRNAEGTERHVYDDNWQVVADLDEDGNVIRSYVWGEGIDRLLAVNVGGASYYPLTDVQGTVWGYADEQGDVVARWTYDAWGNVLTEEIAEGATELRAVRYRFQGRERSAATGLTNFRMRWYDPETGRWLSKDPIGLSGGLNLYVFCDNNVTNFGDPNGTISPLAAGVAGAASGAIVGGFVGGGKGAIKGAIVGGVGATFGVAAAGMLPVATSATAQAMIGGALTGAFAESLNQLLSGGDISLLKVGSAAGVGMAFSVLGGVGIGIAAGLWTEFWNIYHDIGRSINERKERELCP